ncbi:putative exported protein [Halobacteriovorax marinus SJ]|uniref:Exported protein n=1 Tax=Halobacteriovorax marinus (strain ATCC BAA-682 / DSM 15412 / SJ) TaxID=862908 RepID=E1WYA8_HALMS|nr:hypothetical protein [Halobacteriovorax marinus]CBW25956.1 putative exported protein [Halobacteriovorax marinus SJ]
MNSIHGAVAALLIILAPISTIASGKKSTSWVISNPEWTPSFEKQYSEFIAGIGKAKKSGDCSTTDQCLRSRVANPRFYNLNPSNLKSIFADCADLPYVLRAYFSWMNGLPFSFPNALLPAKWFSEENQLILAEIQELQRELADAGFFRRRIINSKIKKLRRQLNGGSRKVPDLRYNADGNVIKSKRMIKNGDDINEVLTSVVGSISTASFRTNASANGEGEKFRDTYPVKVDRDAIVPGTILYDPNGHIAVVYEVTKNGKIHLIDAHPDNSLTAITYGEKFSRTSVKIGGGFSNWRPFTYQDSKVRFKKNEELDNYSLEQFQKSQDFSFEGRQMSFYEFVRNRLSLGNLVYNPVLELRELLGELCYDFRERKLSVDKALDSRINLKDHPEKLPENIYGTDGEWETYSTPSRDARLKASIREGRDLVKKMLRLNSEGSSSVEYSGSNLKSDLLSVYEEEVAKCRIPLTLSDNSNLVLDLDQMLGKIYKLSFDPYHCVELRWGIEDESSAYRCQDSEEKLEWYLQEQGLRNTIDRDYSLKMDFGLGELENAEISDVYQEDISILGVLRTE